MPLVVMGCVDAGWLALLVPRDGMELLGASCASCVMLLGLELANGYICVGAAKMWTAKMLWPNLMVVNNIITVFHTAKSMSQVSKKITATRCNLCNPMSIFMFSLVWVCASAVPSPPAPCGTLDLTSQLTQHCFPDDVRAFL